MHLNALADGEGMLENGGVREVAGFENFPQSPAFELQVEFLPACRRELQNPARKGIHELVGKNMAPPACGFQSGRESLMPCDAQALQQLPLRLAKRGRNFYNVVVDS